jgi:MFS family permease
VGVEVRLDEVVMRALEKEPERRYQQVRELQAAIDSVTYPTSARQDELDTSVIKPDAVVLRDKQPPFPFLHTTTGWAIIICLLGVAATFQPFFPLAELQIHHRVPRGGTIAQVFGYESKVISGVGAIFASLFLLLITTSFIEPIPLWRSVFIFFGGMGCVLVMYFVILSHKPIIRDSTDSSSGNYSVEVLGNLLTVNYTLVRGEFQVLGKTTVVDMPWGGGTFLTKVAITLVFQIIIALSFGLLLLGVIQLREVLMRRRQKLQR